ncbi:MAG: ChaN family lipoprotein [Bdellovibrionales bacterium]|nr:ChaN family lipoprotein [Bdellovibrionales bacterium]
MSSTNISFLEESFPESFKKNCQKIKNVKIRKVCFVQTQLSLILEKLDYYLLDQLIKNSTNHDVYQRLHAYEYRVRKNKVTLQVGTPVAESEIIDLYLSADIIFYSDNHDSPYFQKQAFKLLKELVHRNKRQVIFMVEWIDSSHQKDLEAFLNGSISVSDLRRVTNFDKVFGANRWLSYRKLLESLFSLYKLYKFKALACLRPNSDVDIMDVYKRDENTAHLIEKEMQRSPLVQVFVLQGQSHILSGNLHQLLASKDRKVMTVLNSISFLYWQQLEHVSNFDKKKYSEAAQESQVYYVNYQKPDEFHSETLLLLKGQLEDKDKSIVTESSKLLSKSYKRIHLAVMQRKWNQVVRESDEIVQTYKSLGKDILNSNTFRSNKLPHSDVIWEELENL